MPPSPRKDSILIRLSSAVAVALLACSLPAFGRATTPAPPDFALAGLAPSDTDILLRIDASAAHAEEWTRVFERVIGTGIGDLAVGHWQRVRARCAQLGGPQEKDPCCASLLAIRFGDDSLASVDWTLATPLFDQKVCAQGLKVLGARVGEDGRFTLTEDGLELRPCKNWLLASPKDSALAEAMQVRALAGVEACGEPGFASAVLPLSRGAIEIVLRHAAPMGGLTALAIQLNGDTRASVHVTGLYDVSPLPVRDAAPIDVAMLSSLGDRVAFAVHESGVGIMDPDLAKLAVKVPGVVPPVEVRRALAQQRLIVVDGAPVKDGEAGVLYVPVGCLAIPFGPAESKTKAANGEVRASIESWLRRVGTIVRMAIAGNEVRGELLEPELVRGGVRHVDFGPGFEQALDGHPISRVSSLNWVLCTQPCGQEWLLMASCPRLADQVGQSLRMQRSRRGGNQDLTMAGVARPSYLAAQLSSFARMRARDGDDNARGDKTALERMAEVLSAIDRVEWRFVRQDEVGFEGRLDIQLAPPDSDGGDRP